MARPVLIGQALTPMVGGYVLERFGAVAMSWGLCFLAILNVLLVCALRRRGSSLC